MNRLRVQQIAFVTASLLLCWLGMQAVHELGHVLGAWATGGRVIKVVLHPLSISRTDVSPNPAPLTVAWAGPLIGCILPILIHFICKRRQYAGAYWFQFFAGFCLLANGAYIGAGSFEGIGDAGFMLAKGSSKWQLWLFGLVTFAAGLKLWDGLGPQFGFGDSKEEVSRRATCLVVIALLSAVLLELAISPRE